MNTLLQLQKKTDWSLRKLCRKTEVPHASFHRWKSRHKRGESMVNTPGPKPKGILDLGKLLPQVQALAHGRERTPGAGQLYQQVCFQISRRRFAALVGDVRLRLRQEEEGQMQRLQWTLPGAIWAMDDTELFGHTVFLLLVMDLASRYKFEPMVGERMHGPVLAVRLEEMFEQHGAPLFFKRDNGGNLNHHDLDPVFQRYGVITLNSPPYYPRYNGAMERGIREIKESIREQALQPIEPQNILALPELANHESDDKLSAVSPEDRALLGSNLSAAADSKTAGLGGGNRPSPLLRVREQSEKSQGVWGTASPKSILTLPGLSQAVVTQWNHRRRRCLQQRTSCAMLAAGKAKLAQYSLRQRKEMQNCINELQAQIGTERGWTASRVARPDTCVGATARRLAIETWFQREGLLTLARSQNVLPRFQ